jgi:cytochrome bd-type quinol oxidase subunit 1
MRRTIFLPAFLFGFTTAVAAQTPAAAIKLADVAGVWDSKSMVGPNDSVVVATVLTATATDSGWTMTLAGREPVAVRVIAMGGDSIVTEAGPYPSILRAGLTVTSLRMVSHYSGDQMKGMFWAEYSSGDKASGRVIATRRK